MNIDYTFRRGDICWMEGERPVPGQTYVLRGHRPCVVVSCSVANRFSSTLIVAPITHSIKDRMYPGQFDILLNGEVSRVRCDQLRVIDKHQLEPPHAMLSGHLMNQLDNALAEIVGLKESDNIAQEVQSI